MKVLVTDDDDDSRELVRLTLSRYRTEVVEADSGEACLRLARASRPDVILLDVMMPFMDGPSTLTALRADPATAAIPVVFLTASVMPSEVDRLRRMGARAVISKPFDTMALPGMVREILGTPVAAAPPSPAVAAASAAAAEADGLAPLRAQFVRRAQEKTDAAARLLDALAAAPSDRAHLNDLMRFFHGLAGVGTSYGFPRVTAVAKEGELECLALLDDGASPTSADRDNWTRLLGALAHELRQPPSLSAVVSPGGVAARAPELLLVSADAAVVASLAPLLEQEGHAPRPLPTRVAAVQALEHVLPAALIVDSVLEDGSGYDVIDRLRSRPGGEGVPVIVLGPSGGFMEKVEAIHGGADGYFEKPVEWKALMRRLQHLLDASVSHPARILSVEDDAQQASYLTSILASGGYEVAVCADPTGFERALAQFQPDLVLMDILLPGISGYDLVRYLRQDERHAALPVLFLTTEGQMQSRSRSAQAGGDDHLTKPILPPVLLSVVASRLERARFLKNLLNRDGLTRLFTHTALLERAQALHAQKGRDAARQCAWVMIDLDHFKSVNDRFGHPVGDRVLAALAALLRRRLRQSDTIGRYGGEEFVVLFEGLAQPEVRRLMERVLEEFRQIDLEAPGGVTFRSTFSAGVAMLECGASLDEWKKAADDALYTAKNAGRNRVTAAAP